IHNASICPTVKHDLFADRLEMVDKNYYLWVSNDKHRQVLTHVLLSGHALVSKHMTWGERYHPESIQRGGDSATSARSALRTRYMHYLCVRQRLYCLCTISLPVSLTCCRN
ncbi:hypothetical protein B0H10DRAFT_2138913, partial [Mycena sp. CBHHK59/15]